jgi:hypothetical protein
MSSSNPTPAIKPQVGLFNIQAETLFALNINGSLQDKLKEIFESIDRHQHHHYHACSDKQFYSIIQSIIASNICNKTTTTRIAYGLFERKTTVRNHLLP